MRDLSIHIITTYSNKDRQQSVLNTWLANNNDYVFYTDFSSDVGNQIELTTNNRVDSGGEKHILEIQRIFREKLYEKYNWFYFCDDDTVPNLKLLNELLKTLDKNKVYGAVGNTWAEDPSLYYLSGGAGYLVHNEIFKNRSHPRLKSIIWGDVQFGLWLREQNIVPVHLNGFKWDHPSIFGMNIHDVSQHEIIKSYLSFHYIKDNNDRQLITNIFN
jgi:hypothetical protein